MELHKDDGPEDNADDAPRPARLRRRRDPARQAADFVAATPHVRVSRSALLHNASVLRNRLEDGVQACAVIKADAYGHGAAVVGDTLRNFSLDGSGKSAVEQLAVATVEEAATLPDFECPLTILRPVENVYLGRSREMLELAVHNGWTLTLTHPAAADDVARLALRRGLLARVQVMVDTGLTRGGCAPADLPRLLARIAGHPTLQLTVVATHLANGEVRGDVFAAEQLRRFGAATDTLDESFAGRVMRSAANSGGVFFAPRSHYDLVRPGLALYGIDPTGRPNSDRPLRPAMRWVAPLLEIHNVRPGDTVGYGRTWRASAATRVGLVPVGYADGYPRCLSNKGVMRLGDADCPVVGHVSMDVTTIDLSAAPHARPGDAVTVLDDDPLSPASAYALAAAADTIPYEILSRIGPRVLRVAADPYDAEIVPGAPADGSEDAEPDPVG